MAACHIGPEKSSVACRGRAVGLAARRARPAVGEAVHAAQHAGPHVVAGLALGERRHGVVLVVEREVPEAVLGLGAHDLGHGVLHDHADLVGEGGVVDVRGGVDRREQGGVAVVVLEALALQGGAARGAARQDAAAPDVAEEPGQVADALEAEHGIEEVDRQHGPAPRGVGRGQGDERGHGAGLGDALLEDLALAVLGVAEDEVGVDRGVALALGGVDLGLGDERLETEGAGLVGDDGRDVAAQGGVADEVAQQAGEGHGGRGRLGARSGEHVGEHRRRRARRRAVTGRTTREGRGPARTLRRPDRYSWAGEPSGGR